MRNHGLKAIVPGNFPERAFSTEYALKDLSYALEMAEAFRSASRGTLDPSFRVHAQTLLAALPWGHSSYDESEVELEEVEAD